MTVGVEEEFGIVDEVSGALVPRADAVFPHAQELLGDAVGLELNLCQIEVGTSVCATTAEVRTELLHLRRGLSMAAARAGCGVLATGTHPFSLWHDQQVDARSDRYRRMEQTYQIIARQQIICGLHVHVGISDRELQVQTMNRVRRWLSVLLALSANSPFWQGQDTGFASYRLQVWQRWPTAGMPPRFSSRGEFDALVDGLRSIDAIEDPTFLYWYVRPSVRYPTLEFRVCDVCLSVDDAVAIAALVRALAWTCAREAAEDVPEVVARRELLEAAVWRAGRFGLDGQLVSPSAMAAQPAVEVVAELLGYVREALEAHGEWEEVSGLVDAIVRGGNGAARQRAALARRQNPFDVVSYAMAATVALGTLGFPAGPSNGEAEVTDRDLFVFVATYTDEEDAKLDYEVLKDLHAEGVVGTYDAAIVVKDADGKVHVHKHEKPTQHGVTAGVVVGAIAGILFPPSILASAAVAGTAGGLIGHFWRGMSRSDVKELGELLDESQAALVVIGESKLEEYLARTLKRASKQMAKEIKGDIADFERALAEAASE